MKKICIVSNELQDIPISGGAGTANQHLACYLANSNFEVHILYIGTVSTLQKSFFKEKYSITLHEIPKNIDLYGDFLQHNLAQANTVYMWFTEIDFTFDIVLFHDYMSLGYYCLQLKNALPCFASTALGIICHGSVAWCYDVNAQTLFDSSRNTLDNMERVSISLADFVLIPSHYLAQWMQNRGWNLPEDWAIIPYAILPESGIWGAPATQRVLERIEEIVFFGRLEARKGVDVFIQALALLPPAVLAKRRITFLGWDGPIPQHVLAEQLAALDLPVPNIQFITNYDASQARAYLREHAALAVMPSTGDNSPCVIYECLADGIPFIASTMGGQSELIHPDDHLHCLAAPYPAALAKVLERRLQEVEVRLARPSEALRTASDATLAFFNRQVQKAASKVTPQSPPILPLISIVIPTFNRPDLVGEAVRSALEQDYPHIEVVIVNDGSTHPDVAPTLAALERQDRRIRVIQQENRYLGAARNTGARHAAGEYVVFLDDDNRLFPNYVSTCFPLLYAANADAIVPAMQRITPDNVNIDIKFAGGAAGKSAWGSAALLENIFGDACGMVRRDVCLQYPFKEVFGITHEDWHFWAQLAVSGKTLLPFPQPLFYYRVSEDSMIQSTSKYKNFHVHADVCRQAGKMDCLPLAEFIYFA